MLLTLGTRLGAFVIEARLGAGGMGEVYRATDTRLARAVALKVLHPRPDLAVSPLQLLEREARAVAALNHPHICTLYDLGVEGTLGYLVMEHLEGRTLDHVLREGPLPSTTALFYARQLASALSAAHAKGVIHRDLKPSNLFLTNDGTLKVLDFGLAKALVETVDDTTGSATATGTFVGTVGYAAPEQLRGEPVDQRTDIFAVGAVLSEFVSGRPAFTRSSSAETMRAILHGESQPLPSTTPAPLAAAIARCLASDPAQRFQSANALLDALESTDGLTAAHSVPVSTVRAPAAATPPSIAVLPFADLSPGKDQEYFCDGMADELIAALMSLDGVRVASRTSAFQFKGRAEDVGEIGRRLKVKTVLEGSVRLAGTRLRVTVQLTDVAAGFQVWSERYDRALDDVFAVQDEIARAIVDKLKVDLKGKVAGHIVVPGNRNIDAYNLYLQGRYSIHKLTKEGLENGMAYLHRALELNPDYAEAHAELAHCYLMFAMFSVAPPRKVMPIATQAVTRALAINPNLASGLLSLGVARFWYDWDWAGAEAAYRRAVELTPGDSWPRACYSIFLSLRGRHDDAIAEAKRAHEIDPVSPINSLNVINALVMARRFDEGIDTAARAIALEPAFFSTYWALALAQAAKRQYPEAVATLERGRPYASGDPTLEGFLGWAYGLAGDRESARTIAHQLEARRNTSYVAGTCIALVYQGLGEMDEAMRWYRQAYADRATECCSYAVGTHLEVARQDPRFLEVVRLIEMGGPEGAA